MGVHNSGDQGDPGIPADYPLPYPSQSPSYPPQQPRKSSLRGRVVGGSIVAVLLILICSGVGVAIYIGAQKAKDAVHSNISALAASATVTRFCTYYESQDYGSIYQMLSKAAQERTSQAQFATHQAAVDRTTGEVVRCMMDSGHSLPSIGSDGMTSTARIQVTRGESAKLTAGTITLVYENSEWKIDSADSSLKLV
ncbi:MAG: hypothetical protein ACM3N4_07425 [Nitrososphaerota archaeon]